MPYYFVYLKGLISLSLNIIKCKIFVYMGNMMNAVWFLTFFLNSKKRRSLKSGHFNKTIQKISLDIEEM